MIRLQEIVKSFDQVHAMAIEFPCWNCGKRLKAVEAHGGRKCKCTGCESVNSIPGTRQEDIQDEEEERVEELDKVESENPFEDIARESPVDLAVVREQVRNNAFYLMTLFGGTLLISGLLILLYFLFIYDTTVADIYRSWIRVSNSSRMNTQLVASISSGVMMVVGAIMIGFATLRK